MTEPTLAEQVWLMVAAPNTGRPRSPVLAVVTDVAALLDLLMLGALTLDGDLVHRHRRELPDPVLNAAFGRIESGRDPGPLRLPHALNAIHPTWDTLTKALEHRGLVHVQQRRRADLVSMTPEGRMTRRGIVMRCRAALADPGTLADSTAALLRVMWAADCAETGLAESLFHTDTTVLAPMYELMKDDPLADRLAASVVLVSGPGNLLSLPNSAGG